MLLIDVDNVLNVAPGPRRPDGDWQVHEVRSYRGAEYTLHLNPEHGRWLTGLAELKAIAGPARLRLLSLVLRTKAGRRACATCCPSSIFRSRPSATT